MHENPYFHEILTGAVGTVVLAIGTWFLKRLWTAFTTEFEAKFGAMVALSIATPEFKRGITDLTREAMSNFAEGLIEQQIGIKQEMEEIHKSLAHRIEMRHEALLTRLLNLHSDLVDAGIIPNGHDKHRPVDEEKTPT